MTSEALTALLKARYRLDWDGIHGIAHWQRVRVIGSLLAASNGADNRVVEAFAFLHDSCRIDDRADPEHGARAAMLAAELNGRFLSQDAGRLTLLQFACVHHEKGKISSHVTIGTCWDADRLDLGRIAIYPDSEYLSTSAARDADFIEWAYNLS